MLNTTANFLKLVKPHKPRTFDDVWGILDEHYVDNCRDLCFERQQDCTEHTYQYTPVMMDLVKDLCYYLDIEE